MSRGPKQDRVVPTASGVRQACLALKPVVGIPIPGVTFSVVIVGDQGHPGNWADDVQRTLRFCRWHCDRRSRHPAGRIVMTENTTKKNNCTRRADPKGTTKNSKIIVRLAHKIFL